MTLPSVWTSYVEELMHNLDAASSASLDPFHTLLLMEWWSTTALDEELNENSTEFVKAEWDNYDLRFYSKLMHVANAGIFRALLNLACRGHWITIENTNEVTKTLSLGNNEEGKGGEFSEHGHNEECLNPIEQVQSQSPKVVAPTFSTARPSLVDVEVADAATDGKFTYQTHSVQLDFGTRASPEEPRAGSALLLPSTKKETKITRHTSKQHFKGGLWGCCLCDKTFSHRDSVYNHFRVKHKPEGHAWSRSMRKELQKPAEE